MSSAGSPKRISATELDTLARPPRTNPSPATARSPARLRTDTRCSRPRTPRRLTRLENLPQTSKMRSSSLGLVNAGETVRLDSDTVYRETGGTVIEVRALTKTYGEI